jgi:hypothetical protein
MLHSGLPSRRVETLLILVVWLVFLILALRTFGPDSVHINFSSDSAIPVLMANDDRPITVFDTYYYGADRWGAWPLIIAKAVHLSTGFLWTDQRLHYARTVWVFFGLLVLVALNSRAAPAVLVSGLIVLCLEPTPRRLMFDLSQLYSWQLPVLFLGWFCVRRLFRGHVIFWSAAFYFCAFFAIWSSVASVPFLAVLITIEALRSHFVFKKSFTTLRIVVAVALLLAASASEYLMKMNYHRFSLKRFGFDYKTGMALDFGYFRENLIGNWQTVFSYHLFPLLIVAICFGVGVAAFITYALVTQRGSLLTRFLEDQTFTMVLALTAMAVVNFALTIAVNHVRTSNYDARFHNLTFLFGAMSGLLVIYLGIRVLADRVGVTRYVIPLALTGALILLCVNFPPRVVNELYTLERESALALSQKAPKGILMGGYWQTYVFAGLQPTNTMLVVPFEGDFNRTPWTYKDLKHSQQVVVEYRKSGLVEKDSPPPNELRQHDNLLKLQDAHFYANGPYAFALYVNESQKP